MYGQAGEVFFARFLGSDAGDRDARHRSYATRCRVNYGRDMVAVGGEGALREGRKRNFSNSNISFMRHPQALIVYILVPAYSGHISGIRKLLYLSPFWRLGRKSEKWGIRRGMNSGKFVRSIGPQLRQSVVT
jgi:hypothetical protein